MMPSGDRVPWDGFDPRFAADIEGLSDSRSCDSPKRARTEQVWVRSLLIRRAPENYDALWYWFSRF